eukprot:scaffold163017_cov34-Attheya_sp.AAC.2
MVYDATQSGLNEALWAPNFPMPMLSSLMRMVSYETFMMDQDLGEMFLNFMLDPKIRPYAGVDLTHVAEAMGVSLPKGKKRLFERWERCLMGAKPCPYNATKAFFHAEEVIRGDRRDPTSCLR